VTPRTPVRVQRRRTDGVHYPHLSRIAELSGHDLSCRCKPGQPCPADLLIALANPRKAD